MIRPITDYTISLAFGAIESGSRFGKHIGVDYAGPEGRVVLSPVNGVITISELTPDVGNIYEIKEDGNGRLHRLMHLKVKPLFVGDKVAEGQSIAKSGGAAGQPWSGTQSTGPHLHLDVRKAGTVWSESFANYYDPEELINEDSMPTPAAKSQVEQLFGAYTGRLPNTADYDRWVGAPLGSLVDWLYTLPEAQAYYQRVSAALKGDTANATALTPGLYKVS